MVDYTHIAVIAPPIALVVVALIQAAQQISIARINRTVEKVHGTVQEVQGTVTEVKHQTDGIVSSLRSEVTGLKATAAKEASDITNQKLEKLSEQIGSGKTKAP